MDYSTISAEDLALTCFRTGDELAWSEFIRRFHPLIARVVLRVAHQWGDASPQIVDDLVQETYLKLCSERCRFLQNFQSAHEDAIYAYIKVFAANLAHDYFRTAKSQKRGGKATIASIGGTEESQTPPRGASELSVSEREVLIHQIDACLRDIVAGSSLARDRKIFWLYYRAGLAASAIAALPTIGLTTKGVESTLLRLTREVRQRLIAGKKQISTEHHPAEGIRTPKTL